MNYLAAVNSRMSYKRRLHIRWREPFDPKKDWREICREEYGDVIADDWVIEEKPISITRGEFFETVAEVLKERGIKFMGPSGLGRVEREHLFDTSIGDIADKIFGKA